jgi:uncharacterized protein
MPYQANIKKRLIKSPKFYWRDTGLLHAQLNAPSEDDLVAKPWVGTSWEGFVIEQVLTGFEQNGLRAEPFFLRTSDRHEIDVILESGSKLLAIEIKLTTSPNTEDMSRLSMLSDQIGATVKMPCLSGSGVLARRPAHLPQPALAPGSP